MLLVTFMLLEYFRSMKWRQEGSILKLAIHDFRDIDCEHATQQRNARSTNDVPE